MNRLTALFDQKKENILNVYFTAGYPALDDTIAIIQSLEKAGVDLIEIGMPYSDPLADGLTIQESGAIALQNGMTLDILFQQVEEVRQTAEVPLVLMGYYNQMMQYGVQKFLARAAEVGIDGLIIPDLPMDIYEAEHKAQFEAHDMLISFLITPETSDERIQMADNLSSGFVYMVSQSSITGTAGDISSAQQAYFQRIASMQSLSRPRLIGFGIHDHQSYSVACAHSNGAIIGSAFIRALKKEGTLTDIITKFVNTIRQPAPIV